MQLMGKDHMIEICAKRNEFQGAAFLLAWPDSPYVMEPCAGYLEPSRSFCSETFACDILIVSARP